jgi:hypothetical protein
MTARGWLFLTLGQIAVVATVSATSNALDQRAAATGHPVSTVASATLAVVGLAALLGFLACVPIVVIKLFLAGQTRIGNAGHPAVGWLANNETMAVRGVWLVWLLGAIVAAPAIVREIRQERAEARAPRADPVVGFADAPVTTPAAGSPVRQAILDAVRAQIGTTSRFRIDHVRVAANWAFVRATEIVDAGGSEQETDLTVAALLELPIANPPRPWNVVEL